MRRARLLLIACLVAAFSVLPVSPVSARHTCGLEEIDPTVNRICDYGPHDPKGTLVWILCWLSPTC